MPVSNQIRRLLTFFLIFFWKKSTRRLKSSLLQRKRKMPFSEKSQTIIPRTIHLSEIDEEKHTLFTMFKALRTVVPVYITVEPEHKSIYFSVPYSFQCKKSHYIFLADEITHINSGIRFGGCQLNYNSGTVSYNYAYNYIKDHFSKDIFLETMKMNILSGDIFYEGLRKLAEDNIPSERIKQLHENLLEVLEEQK